MKNFLPILSIFLLLILFQNVAAQEESIKQEKPKFVSCDGCRNPRIIYLALPKYSDDAKKVRAFGKIEVEILINEKGKVKTAKAISGHSLLRIEAEKAALKSKFKPFKLSGKPVKVSATIVYFFRI